LYSFEKKIKDTYLIFEGHKEYVLALEKKNSDIN